MTKEELEIKLESANQTILKIRNESDEHWNQYKKMSNEFNDLYEQHEIIKVLIKIIKKDVRL